MLVWHGALLWTGQVLCGHDLREHFIPMRDGQAARGWFTPWQNESFSGQPLAGSVQSGIFYLPNWLHWFLSPERAFTLLTMVHVLFGGIGFCLFARERFSREAALFAGALWVFGGYQVLRIATGVVIFNYALAWVPWMLWAAERQSLAARGLKWTGLLALFGAMQLLVGSPQMVQITWFGLVVWTAARAFTQRDAALRILGGFGVAGVLTLLCAAPMLAAVANYQSQSFDRAAGDEWAFLSDGSLEPRVIVSWFFPEFFAAGNAEDVYWGSAVGYAETNIYLGILPLAGALFLPLMLVRRDEDGVRLTSEEKRWCISLLIVGVFGVLVALGSHGFLFRPLTQFVPTFSFFRVPARWLLWLVVAVAVFGAWGMDLLLRLREGSEVNKQAILRWIIASGVFALLAFIVRLRMPDLVMRMSGDAAAANPDLVKFATSAAEWGIMMGIAAAAIGAVWLAGKLNRKAFVILFLLFALVDLRRYWMPYTDGVPVEIPREELVTEAPFHRIAAGDFRPYFFPDTPLIQFAREQDGRIHYNDSLIVYFLDEYQREFLNERPMSYGIEITRGYQQQQLESYVEDYYASFPMPANNNIGAFLPQVEIKDRRFLDAYNVVQFLSYDMREVTPAITEAGLTEKKQLNAAGLSAWTNPHARGWAWLSDRQEFLDAEPAALGTVEVEERSATLINGIARAEGEAWLHISAPDADGWNLVASDASGTIIEGADSRSVLLPKAGEWHFTRSYRTPAYHWGLIALMFIAFMGVAVLIALGVVNSRRLVTS
jgi:hypothetical protein